MRSLNPDKSEERRRQTENSFCVSLCASIRWQRNIVHQCVRSARSPEVPKSESGLVRVRASVRVRAHALLQLGLQQSAGLSVSAAVGQEN